MGYRQIGLCVLVLLLMGGGAYGQGGSFGVEYPAETYTADTDPANVDFYDYDFTLDSDPDGYVVDPKNYLEDLDPTTKPDSIGGGIKVFATRGETEPAAFVIYAQEDLGSIDIFKPYIDSETSSFNRANIERKTVFRTFRRTSNSVSDPAVSGCDSGPLGNDGDGGPGYCFFESNRYVIPYQRFGLDAGHFREVLLYFHVSENAEPGTYSGTFTIRVNNDYSTDKEIPITLEVLPYKLKEDPDNQTGVYYELLWHSLDANGVDPEKRAVAQLKDIRSHHGTIITGTTGWWSDNRVIYCVDGMDAHGNDRKCQGVDGSYGNVDWNFTMVERLLDVLQQAGYEELDLVLGTGFQHLAKQMGHPELSRRNLGEDGNIQDPGSAIQDLLDDEEFLNAAAEVLKDFKALQAQWPQYDFYYSHMDEVFNERQLGVYEAFSQIFRQAADSAGMPDAKLYTTFHTHKTNDIYYDGGYIDQERARRDILDPVIDLRGHHGYTFEHLLMREDDGYYADELAASGDRATYYHNARGWWYNTEVERLISGLWQWSVPLQARLQWIYHNGAMIRRDGDPFEPRWMNQQFNERDDIDYVLSVPCHTTVRPYNPYTNFEIPCDQDNITPVPTRRWEAMREGQEDIQYLYTLQETINSYSGSPVITEAQNWLDSLRNALPVEPPSDVWNYEEDFDWVSPYESPITQHMSDQFSIDHYQEIRRQAADFTVEIMRTATDAPDNVEDGVPAHTRLLDNYPDPFRAATTIPFELTASTHVTISVYNILGQRVATLVDRELTAGRHTVTWRPDNSQPSGVYYYRLDTESFTETRSVTRVK